MPLNSQHAGQGTLQHAVIGAEQQAVNRHSAVQQLLLLLLLLLLLRQTAGAVPKEVQVSVF